MNIVYRVSPDGTSTAMQRVRCSDEGRELQEILEKNLDLLPGDQIDPEEPRRWLLVKREMPVQDPGSGQNRWNIDFLLLDQSAMPTFVECKRFADTRARREVVGQMLEYAANGSYYWTKDSLQADTVQSIEETGLTLDEALQRLAPDDDLDADGFFQRAEDNLRQGQVRLIFFLEESPFELKSIVEFLNRQMERTEVLLVEARLNESDGTIVVVPTLFGYTEEARQIKRVVVTSSAGSRRKWNEAAFFEAARTTLEEAAFGEVQAVYEHARSRDLHISWGTGTQRGSFNVKAPDICPRSVFTVWSDGMLSLNFGWLNASERAEAFRDALKDAVVDRLGWSMPSDYSGKFVNLPILKWLSQTGAFLGIVDEIVARFRKDTAE